MKLFGVILLAGYFLAREQEGSPQGKESLRAMIQSVAVYWLCAGLATASGFLPTQAQLQPVVILFAALLPGILFKARPICFFAGAATAFCVLRWMPDLNRVAIALLCSEIAVLAAAFLYEGAWRRVWRLHAVPAGQKSLIRVLLLFSLSALLLLVYQKAVQIY